MFASALPILLTRSELLSKRWLFLITDAPLMRLMYIRELLLVQTHHFEVWSSLYAPCRSVYQGTCNLIRVWNLHKSQLAALEVRTHDMHNRIQKDESRKFNKNLKIVKETAQLIMMLRTQSFEILLWRRMKKGKFVIFLLMINKFPNLLSN